MQSDQRDAKRQFGRRVRLRLPALRPAQQAGEPFACVNVAERGLEPLVGGDCARVVPQTFGTLGQIVRPQDDRSSLIKAVELTLATEVAA